MKFATILAALALPALALAAPAPAADAEALPAPIADAEAFPVPEPVALPEAQAPGPDDGNGGTTRTTAAFADFRITCSTWTDGVRYRTCPWADNRRCPARGQYPRGKKVKLVCITTGQSVNGNRYWVKAENGYYSSAYYFGGCYPTSKFSPPHRFPAALLIAVDRLPWCK
ncbi:hypothetical protein FN846DRAFT_1020021 [Sphaerosporella brunnea]|uniref:Ig-like domain-containing protein n=1 Tax=Sphaerosporella brunnea TaxID=1250544 RepID=A0A5J5F480_9PEZI|nr:hypothetical protein FN846DRAFT_1020021 [Sphaerosporella brunnea]